MTATELKPCPFCGGEAELVESDYGMYITGYAVYCKHCCTKVGVTGRLGEAYEWTPIYDTEAEAIAAWNTRAAMEFDDWFYLPKPKQQLFSYTDGLSFDDLSMKATGTVDVYAITSAVQKWQEEALNSQIIERICEVFKPERTCHIEHPYYGDAPVINGQPRCSECKAEFAVGTFPNYCPNCGAKVVRK